MPDVTLDLTVMRWLQIYSYNLGHCSIGPLGVPYVSRIKSTECNLAVAGVPDVTLDLTAALWLWLWPIVSLMASPGLVGDCTMCDFSLVCFRCKHAFRFPAATGKRTRKTTPAPSLRGADRYAPLFFLFQIKTLQPLWRRSWGCEGSGRE